MNEQDQVFFRNFSITVAILAIMMLLFLMAARSVSHSATSESVDVAAIDERTKPVGTLVTTPDTEVNMVATTPDTIANENAATTDATSGEIDGKAIYSGICVSCHGSGIPGIPQLGDTAAWADRITRGKEELYTNAIVGYVGSSGMPMPAKGGNPALSEAEVKAAVDYMITNSQ